MSRNIDRWVRTLRDQVSTLEVPEAIEEAFGPYRDDPVAFCRDVLGVESATRRSDGTEYQFEALSDLAAQPRVSVRSGHGIGKSAIDAWAAIWWLLTRPLSRVVVVAPEFSRQVRAVLFSEMRKWARRSNVRLPLSVLSSRVVVEGYGEEWAAIGMPATEPDRIEGMHSEAGVLLILDETKGIGQDVYDALQGALTGLEDNRLLVTSTPGGPSGPFYRIWSKSEGWALHHIPSTDSSNVSVQWVEDRKRDWGEGSPLYQARVLGEFPDSGEGVLFPLNLLEAAVGRELPVEDDTGITLGIDVARSIAGDLNALAVSKGGKLSEVATWRSPDTMQVVERVVQEAAKRGPKLIRVDVGGPGAGVCDRLRQLGYSVDEVYFGGGPRDRMRFKNRRAELFWSLRERLERGEVSLPDDDDLMADLAAVRYFFAADGKIQLEAKDEIRKQLGRSPDRADAVALATLLEQGLMFPELQDRLHLVEARDPVEWTSKEVAIHWGYLDSAHVLWIETTSGMEGPPRSWVYRELVVSETPPPVFAQMVVDRTPRSEEIRRVVIGDSEGAWGSVQDGSPSPVVQMMKVLRQRSWSVRPAMKGQRAGWILLHTYFDPRRNGGPLLRVLDNCPALWHELTSVSRGIGSHDREDVEPHQADHSVRALRYWAQGWPEPAPPTEAELRRVDPNADKLVDPRTYEAKQWERMKKYGIPAIRPSRPKRKRRRPW
jgi:hypothetical protein